MPSRHSYGSKTIKQNNDQLSILTPVPDHLSTDDLKAYGALKPVIVTSYLYIEQFILLEGFNLTMQS